MSLCVCVWAMLPDSNKNDDDDGDDCHPAAAVECIKMCGVNDIADSLAMRTDKFIKRYLLNSSVVCEICSLVVK